RSYTFKVNRKERRAALRSALSLHAQRGSVAVLDTAAFKAPKTSQAFDLLDDWGQDAPTLVVLTAEERDAALSFRNLARVAVLTHESVGIADLLGAASLLISAQALDALSARANAERTTAEVTPAKPSAKRSKAKQAAADEAPAETEAQASQPDQQVAPEPAAQSAEEPAEGEEKD
ncbi:MAG: 50S ribosomal protein L4, partial [Solirubrobacteraceae bacterium]